MTEPTPGWQPNWSDVAFDHAAAARAQQACERAAARLARDADSRQGLTETALDQWRGPYADDFTATAAAHHDRTRQTQQALRRLAANLGDAAQRAAAEQARREDNRDRWRRERDRLRAAAHTD